MSYHTSRLRIKADQVAPPTNAPPCPLRGTSHTGKRLTGFSVACRLPANPVRLPPRGGKRVNLGSPVGWQRTRFEGAKRRANRSESLSRRVSCRRLRGCILRRSRYRVVTPSQAFSWEISRLIVAVAIFTYRAIVHAATARNAAVLQRTAEPGPSWCLYCTLKHLPLGARPTEKRIDSPG